MDNKLTPFGVGFFFIRVKTIKPVNVWGKHNLLTIFISILSRRRSCEKEHGFLLDDDL